MFDAAHYVVFFVSVAVTYASLLIQSLAIARLSNDWYDWYERDAFPCFKMEHVAHGGLQSLLMAASSIGFFFLLRDENGSPDHLDATWSFAVSMYALYTILDGVYLIPFWHWCKLNLAVYLLGITILVGAIYLVSAALGATNAGLVTLPIAPRILCQCGIMAYHGWYLRKRKIGQASHKEEDTTSLPQYVKNKIAGLVAPSNTGHHDPSTQPIPAYKPASPPVSNHQLPAYQHPVQQRTRPPPPSASSNGGLEWMNPPGPGGVDLGRETVAWAYKPGVSGRILCLQPGNVIKEISAIRF